MRYLQITTTGICLLLGVVAYELRALRPPTFDQLEEVAKSGNAALQKQMLWRLPVVQVHEVLNTVSASIPGSVTVDSVRGNVAVRGTIPVEVENSVPVYNGDKALKVEVKE